jgi:hypothetical protein
MKFSTLVKNVLAIAIVFSVLISFNSCSKSKGCTDPLAETYDADAEESDPTLCVYAREKFVGNYSGSLICPGALSGTINNPVYDFAISERAGGTVQQVSVDVSVFGAPFKLAGTVDKNTLTIDQTIPNLPFTVPPIGATTVNLIAKGSATMSTDNKTLDGTIDITIVLAANNAPVATDKCPIKGTKK